MIQIALAIINIIYLLLKNKFEQDADKKKRVEDLHGESKDAIVSRDATKLHAIIDKLRSS